METWRREAPSRLRRAAPAAIGLADVVCCIGQLSTKSVVREFMRPLAPRLARGARVAGTKSVPRKAATLRARHALHVSLHPSRRAQTDWRVVAARVGARIFAGHFIAGRHSAAR